VAVFAALFRLLFVSQLQPHPNVRLLNRANNGLAPIAKLGLISPPALGSSRCRISIMLLATLRLGLARYPNLFLVFFFRSSAWVDWGRTKMIMNATASITLPCGNLPRSLPSGSLPHGPERIWGQVLVLVIWCCFGGAKSPSHFAFALKPLHS
jgi:hypothetical protein